MHQFYAFNEKSHFLSAILDFMPQKKCLTLTSWHTSELDSAHINWQETTTKILYMSKNKVGWPLARTTATRPHLLCTEAKMSWTISTVIYCRRVRPSTGYCRNNCHSHPCPTTTSDYTSRPSYATTVTVPSLAKTARSDTTTIQPANSFCGL